MPKASSQQENQQTDHFPSRYKLGAQELLCLSASFFAPYRVDSNEIIVRVTPRLWPATHSLLQTQLNLPRPESPDCIPPSGRVRLSRHFSLPHLLFLLAV